MLALAFLVLTQFPSQKVQHEQYGRCCALMLADPWDVDLAVGYIGNREPTSELQ
jgi:hypothetical protein